MSPTRVPPSDLLAERTLIGCVLLDVETLDHVAPIIAAKHFYSDAHRTIWESILSLLAESRTVDTVTLRDHLVTTRKLQAVGGDEYLLSLLDTIPTVGNAIAYARVIVDHARVRQMIAANHRIAADGYAGVERVSEYLDRAESLVSEIARTPDDRDTGAWLGSVVRDVHASIADARENGTRLHGLPTGFAKLDELLTGWHPGDLTILGGRPGMGKSAVAWSFAKRVAMEGRVSAVFSLEMPKEQWVQRALAETGRVNAQRVRTAHMSHDDWHRLTGAKEDLQRLPIHIDDQPGISLLELRSKLRAIRKQRKDLGLVVIDYLQLMTGDDRAGNREQEISGLSRGLKHLAKEMGVAVIALSQLNRESEKRGNNKRPTMGDLRESGAIEQDADNIILVYRHEVYFPADESQKGIAELLVEKQRNGPPGIVHTRFFREHTRFEDLAEFEQEGMSV